MEIKLDEESLMFIKLTVLESKIIELERTNSRLEKLINKLECRVNGLEYHRNSVCFPIETPWIVTCDDTAGTCSERMIYTNSQD